MKKNFFLLFILAFFVFSLKLFAQNPEVIFSKTPDNSITVNEPTFFLFNTVRFKPEAAGKKKYLETLLDKMGYGAKKYFSHPGVVSIPVSLIQDDVIPGFGQEVWGFHGSYNSHAFAPNKSLVTKFEIQNNSFGGNRICFKTDDCLDKNDWNSVYVLLPSGVKPGYVFQTPLSIKAIKDIISRAPKTYEIVRKNGTTSHQLNKDSLSNYDLRSANEIYPLKIKIILFTKSDDQYMEKISFIDFGNKVIIRYDDLIDAILKFGENYYFLMNSGGGGAISKTVYKLNGEDFEEVYSDGMESD